MPSRFPARTVAVFIATSFVLTSCTLPRSSSPSHEGMVYIPPATGTMVGRWVPRSEASSPTISPTSGVSATSISKLQNEGTKTTLSNPSVGISGGGR